MQIIDCVGISFVVHSGLDSPGLRSSRMSGILLVYGYSGVIVLLPEKRKTVVCHLISWVVKGVFQVW